METGDPAMNSMHRGLLARSFQRIQSLTSCSLSSDSRHRCDVIIDDSKAPQHCSTADLVVDSCLSQCVACL